MGKKEANIPVSGMSASHPMNIKENEYPLMLNGNIQTDINGGVTLTNEHSNILCYNFEPFKVIGELFVPEQDVTFVFLVDPKVYPVWDIVTPYVTGAIVMYNSVKYKALQATTGNQPDTSPTFWVLYATSQIGYLSEFVYNEITDKPGPDNCVDCGTLNKEQPPLETITQTPTCQYTCITQADCLNFSMDMPVRKPVFKKDNCGSTLYFTDFLNPIRALKLNLNLELDDTQRTVIGYTGTCVDDAGDPVVCPDGQMTSNCQCIGHSSYDCSCCEPVYQPRCTTTDADCLKLRLFPQVAHICIEPESVVQGGSLKAGTYQLGACYADENGERATRTFSVSNPVAIFDPNQTISNALDYPTGLAIKFLIKDIDNSRYSFIDIFVVGTLNSVPSVKKYETVSINSLKNGTLEYVLSDFEKGEDVTIDDVLQVFPIYEKAQEITSGGNTLLLGNLTGPRDLNLQQVANKISPSIKWVSSEANEWFYNDGSNAANYRSYLRDEVYALGIVFERNNTLDTCAYPLIGREPNTGFSIIEDPTNVVACGAQWALWLGGGFVSDEGFNIFTFVGEWNEFRTYHKRATSPDHIPYDVVFYNGVYYIAKADSTNVVPGTDLAFWRPIGDPTDPCILCKNDLEDAIYPHDILIPPGCEHGKRDTPGLFDKNWEVYNTACNSGLICAPEMQTVSCVDEQETVTCRSFRYTVPTLSAEWAVTVAPGPVIITTNNDPSTIGIFVGSVIHCKDNPSIDGAIVTIIGPGNQITASIGQDTTDQTTEFIAISFNIDCDAGTVTCEPPPPWDNSITYDPIGGEAVVYLGNVYTSVAIAGNIGHLPTDPTYWTLVGPLSPTVIECNPEDCYNDQNTECRPCLENYPTAIADVSHCIPVWDRSLPYGIGQQVAYRPNTTSPYILYTASVPIAPLGSAPNVNPNWTDNTWTAVPAYVLGAIVSYLGVFYIASVAILAAQPAPNINADWLSLGNTPCNCPPWPLTAANPCNPNFVRTKQDALDYYNGIDPESVTGAPRNTFLLCADASLVTFEDSLAMPYMVKSTSAPRKILDASNDLWPVYNIAGRPGTNPPASGSIANLIVPSLDPTKAFVTGTKGPEDPSCFNEAGGIFHVYPPGQPIQAYLFPGINTPEVQPENYNPDNAVAGFNPSPLNTCNDYGVTAPLMYMLSTCMKEPAAHPCGCANCNWASSDYWNIGADPICTFDVAATYSAGDVVTHAGQLFSSIAGSAPGAFNPVQWTLLSERNNSKYQSYWYSFTATALQPTIIVKVKLGYKFADILGNPTPTFAAQGDFRIDAYEGDFHTPAVWSTGVDSVSPATYSYAAGSAEADQGVLILGDVGNASGQPGTDHQIPLIAGTKYFVHIYMLPQGIDKLNIAPLPTGKGSDCIEYEPSDPPLGGDCCNCWYANYGFMNICINSATSDINKRVALSETWQTDCNYTIFYRENKVLDHGCLLQTWEYGPFAYWRSDTKRYPANKEVWGDLCAQPVRHFKFPDVLVSAVQNQDPSIQIDSTGTVLAAPIYNPGRQAKIFPLGFRVDPEDIKAWLKWAATPGSASNGIDSLITEEERLSITGYKLVRGNRVGNKSIAAKGLLFDMWRYREYDYVNKAYSNIWTYFPNYPFNDLRQDSYLERGDNGLLSPPKKQRFAFLSADTTFNSPYLGTELKFESVNFGDALGNFYTVKDHPKYTLLSEGGIALSATLAGVQLAGDALVITGQLLGPTWDAGLSTSYPVGAIVGLVGAIIDLVPKFFIYAHEWRDLIINFGVPQNFAKYYAAVGNYHSSGSLGRVLNTGDKRRAISNAIYLLPGNSSTSDDGTLSKINNYMREESVYLYLADQVTYPGIFNDPHQPYWFSDSSKFLMSDGTFDNKPCRLTDRESNVLSYYASIKYNVPDQYGDIHDIDWLYTGTCVPIHWENPDQSDLACVPVYGGDTFITRMTQKRKFPFFIDTAVGASTGVDIQYQHISNVSNARFYFNSVGDSIANSSSIQFIPVEHQFDEPCGIPKTSLYLKGSMYLFSYGIVSFIGESDYNLNFRLAEDPKFNTFYPFESDIESWTQEYRVPIETRNFYGYNRTYSKQNKENFFCTQPIMYSNAECITTYRNRVINSIPDKDSDFYTDPWRVFLGNDYSDFPLINGQLMGLDGIEREKVLVRFDKTSLVFNAFYTITTDAGEAQIGTGSMFAQKPEEYAKTDLGYGGTQHHAFTSTQYGHFWVDARRSAVFMLPPGAAIEEISLPYGTFFNNNLPFFILKAFPNFPVDNNYKDIGITIGWDNKFDRLFVTKLDYELKSQYVGVVTYTGGKFYDGQTEIFLTNEKYFCNKSWTIGYSPQTKTWISFYSFTPNYYIAHENYFQSGINYPQYTNVQTGIWNHLISNKSYQVYYGALYPFITDVVIKEQLINKQLNSVEYQADFLRFQNDYDYFYNPGVTFNKMVIWSENRNTGNLELVPQASNNLSQSVLYPIINTDSTTVLVTRKENSWRVNQFYDMVRDKYNNVPPMLLNCHPYLRHVNPAAINYFKPTFQKSRLTQDYFTLRLINDKYSNYKIINKWFLEDTMKSYT